ncbi:hypothetical protein TSOC_002973 [Tetrabaena socialis]|uniref:PDZ domain-containing protein n=1 Tax=Tetrabaena socialis TaxID=47790 RepID=A0A2J8ACT7_9CHLO|nr:hypothetical protein TSOC_002973 [Tetrabaena socialis]|eukprot:PNH10328.1 hypothetical protein TSOC_002973 [Tetrabaena socialis]
MLAARRASAPRRSAPSAARRPPRTTPVRAPASASGAASPASPDAPRRILVTAPNDDTGGLLEAEVLASPGSRVFSVSIKKPLGLTLAESGGRIVVESVTGGGHAASAGVAAGDALLATGARAQVGGGKDAQPVLLPTGGQRFSTVSAAIRSNTCSQCLVHLVFERGP